MPRCPKKNVIGQWWLRDDLTSSRVISIAIVPLLEADHRVISPHTTITLSCSHKTRQHSQGSTGLSCARFEFDASSLPLHDNVMMVVWGDDDSTVGLEQRHDEKNGLCCFVEVDIVDSRWSPIATHYSRQATGCHITHIGYHG